MITEREKAILSAYTGIMIGGFAPFHEYVEEILGRPVITAEMGSRAMAGKIKLAAAADFLEIAQATGDSA